MSKYHIAQLNIARLLAPVDSPQLSDFVANLDRINALAEDSTGFVWRLQTEDGDATGIDYFGSDKIVNLSLWGSVEAFTFKKAFPAPSEITCAATDTWDGESPAT